MAPLALAGAAFSTPTLAERAVARADEARWAYVAENERGVMAYDPASVERDGPRVLVWTRAATLDDDGLAMTMLVRNEIDCARRTMAKRLYVPLGEDGAPADRETLDEAGQPIAPGSVGAVLFDKVCP